MYRYTLNFLFAVQRKKGKKIKKKLMVGAGGREEESYNEEQTLL